MRRVLLFILFFISVTVGRSQIVDTAYIYSWLQNDTSFNKDSVDCYLITEQDSTYYFTYTRTLYYQDEFNKFLDHLTRLRIDRIEDIAYSSKINCLSYAGKRTLFVSTIMKQDQREINILLRQARSKFNGKSPHDYPALVIDNIYLDSTISKKAISSLPSDKIYFITVNSSCRPNTFCQDNRSGFVRIWTKINKPRIDYR